MQSDKLNAHEVLSRSDTSGHGEVVPSSIRNHSVDSPFAICQTIVGDFKPLQTCGSGRSGTIDFGKPVADRSFDALAIALEAPEQLLTLVALRDRIISIVRALRTANDVAPPSSNFCAGWYSDDGLIEVRQAFVASKSRIVDVLDRIVTIWSSHALQLPLVDAINGNLLKYGVR